MRSDGIWRGLRRRVFLSMVTGAMVFALPSCSTTVKALGEYALGAAYQALQDAANGQTTTTP